MTKKEKIEAIVESMANWDTDEIVKWAQDTRRGILSQENAKQVDEEYRSAVLGE